MTRSIVRLAFAPATFLAVFCASRIGTWSGITISFCIAQRAFGVRCPGCGVTTSVAALIGGDWTAAIHANVAGPVVFIHFLATLAYAASAIGGVLPQHVLSRCVQQTDRVLLASLLGAWWWHSAN